MMLEDVIEFLKDRYHLQRPPDYSQGVLSVISGFFIMDIQTAMPSIDSRVLVSVEAHHQEKQLERTINTLEKNPEIRKALREKGYMSMPAQLKAGPYEFLTGLHMDPYVGTVNGETFALGIVRETGLAWKESGRNVAGIVAIQSIESLHRYGCILLETGVIQFSSSFEVSQKNIFSYNGFIAPPGVPTDVAPSSVRVQADEYQIFTISHSSNSRKSSTNVLAHRFEHTKKLDHKVFEPVFRETLQAARKLGADEKLRVEAYKRMLRCAEYAVMLANAYTQLQPER